MAITNALKHNIIGHCWIIRLKHVRALFIRYSLTFDLPRLFLSLCFVQTYLSEYHLLRTLVWIRFLLSHILPTIVPGTSGSINKRPKSAWAVSVCTSCADVYSTIWTCNWKSPRVNRGRTNLCQCLANSEGFCRSLRWEGGMSPIPA